jgi:hypothetical protein
MDLGVVRADRYQKSKKSGHWLTSQKADALGVSKEALQI